MSIITLPPLILRLIALHLPIKDIENLCNDVPVLEKAIWNNEYFWCMKFKKDFGSIVQNYKGKWKDLYFAPTYVECIYGELRGLVGDFECLAKDIALTHVYWGCESTAAIDIHNNIWVSGHSTEGRFGFNIPRILYALTKIPDTKAKQVSLSKDHMTIIDLNDNLIVFGQSASELPTIKAKQVCQNMILEMDGTVWYYRRKKYEKLSDIKGKFIAYGYYQIAIIDLNDNLYFYTYELSVRNIENYYKIDNKFKFVSIGCLHAAAIDLDCNVWFWIINNYGTPKLKQVPGIKVEEISVGKTTTLLRDDEGNIFQFNNRDEKKTLKLLRIKGRRISSLPVLYIDSLPSPHTITGIKY